MTSNSINPEIGCRKRFMKVSNEKSPARYCDSFFIKSYLAKHITAVYEGKEPS